LYREWRPKTFKEVVGQEHITRTLRNALAADRAAHAYIFTGPRGTGKTSVAKILARAVNCEKGAAQEPCSTCSVCHAIANGTCMDVIEIDAASNRGIGEIRDLREKVKYSPIDCRMKVYIIDEVHMLTPEAFNALLKTLEEPPEHAMFVLATTEPHRVPPTILSRCQRFDFHRLSEAEIRQRLADVAARIGVSVSDGAMETIARRAEGSLRDALGLLDQCAVYAEGDVKRDDVLEVLGRVGRNVVYQLAEAIGRGDVASALGQIDLFARQGVDLGQFLEDLRDHFRDLLVLLSVRDPAGLVDLSSEDDALYREQARVFGKERIWSALDLLSKAGGEIRFSGRPQLWLELFAVRLCHARGYEEETACTAMPCQEKPKKAGPAKARADGSSPGSVTLDTVEGVWQEVMLQARKLHAPLQALLLDAKPTAVEGETLVLCFRTAFHKGAMERASNARMLGDILESMVGQRLKISCQLRGDSQAVQSPSPPAGDPLDVVAEVFGGALVDLEDNEEGS
jgi:DNA polymerase-3 subunit gamma/tau